MPLRVEVAGGVATLTIDRPERRNAFDIEVARDLTAAWERAADDEDIRVVILTGAGDQAFCTGADLDTLLPVIHEGGFQDGVGAAGGFFLKPNALLKPVIARVNGDAIAGGTELLQACDIRIAADHARFGLQEPRWGLMPGGGSTVRLPRQIPYCHAMDILLTGRIFGADEAARIGLVNRVVPAAELDVAVAEVVARLLRNGPVALRNIKQAVLEARGLPDNEAFQVEADAVQRTLATLDAREGPRAFVEKRDPVFLGR
jgi:enoyl-CoA hydratase